MDIFLERDGRVIDFLNLTNEERECSWWLGILNRPILI